MSRHPLGRNNPSGSPLRLPGPPRLEMRGRPTSAPSQSYSGNGKAAESGPSARLYLAKDGPSWAEPARLWKSPHVHQLPIHEGELVGPGNMLPSGSFSGAAEVPYVVKELDRLFVSGRIAGPRHYGVFGPQLPGGDEPGLLHANARRRILNGVFNAIGQEWAQVGTSGVEAAISEDSKERVDTATFVEGEHVYSLSLQSVLRLDGAAVSPYPGLDFTELDSHYGGRWDTTAAQLTIRSSWYNVNMFFGNDPDASIGVPASERDTPAWDSAVVVRAQQREQEL